ncbi:DUF6270 domain-containing protein [Pseudarthrobacter raffinosi]|uniref:DUF6270 domain-containing protein n=1 Tax=Pseudarthrobacter raffinosi TaxID=2953651 RepID=UPI00208ED4DB|nr:DUF6270 domain-containing protein [Pseudarthrobacter sp. MDT3-28]MCO4238657.1 DUF6270 domain-containing protein [Pseudarthrobacter sp. MDT3-28]
MRSVVTTCRRGAASVGCHLEVRVLIYGSCISRDSLELARRPGVELAGYSARSSLLSAFARRPTNLAGSSAHVRSSFQRRMLEADAEKSLPKVLRSLPYDLLLVDIVDERFNVLSKGEERLTDSPALRESDFPANQAAAWRRIDSGSDEHFEGWVNALDRMLNVVGGLPRPAPVAFLDAGWATTVAGAGADRGLSHAGRTPDAANSLYARYREYFCSKLPEGQIIRPPANVIISDPNHKWGLAPFHYVQDFYDFVGDRLSEIGSGI